jgi:hypothetical protein
MQYRGQLHVSAVTVGELFTWALRAKASPKRLPTLLSNSHFEVLAGIGRRRDLQSLEHEAEQLVPALK